MHFSWHFLRSTIQFEPAMPIEYETMSIVSQNGEPLGYGWNDIAAQEMVEKNAGLRMISDAEFETLFPLLVVAVCYRPNANAG